MIPLTSHDIVNIKRIRQSEPTYRFVNTTKTYEKKSSTICTIALNVIRQEQLTTDIWLFSSEKKNSLQWNRKLTNDTCKQSKYMTNVWKWCKVQWNVRHFCDGYQR